MSTNSTSTDIRFVPLTILVVCLCCYFFLDLSTTFHSTRLLTVDENTLSKLQSDASVVNEKSSSKPPGNDTAVNQKQHEKFDSKKKKFLIYTSYRSASSFVGELFNNHLDIYYMFEPLKLLSLQRKVSHFYLSLCHIFLR